MRINDMQIKTQTTKPMQNIATQKSPSCWTEAAQLEQKKQQTPVYQMASNEIANELLKKLNGNDKARIKELLDGIDENNVYNTYAYYYQYAKNNKEIAATDAEKTEMKKIWPNYRKIKHGAKRTETLYQGILNNKALNVDEKRTYLRKISDEMIQYAQNKNIPAGRIKEFSDKLQFRIDECTLTKNPNSIAINALDLEEDLAKMLGF